MTSRLRRVARVVSLVMAFAAHLAEAETDAIGRLKAADAARIATIDRVRPSVVAVFGPGGAGGGSGVLVSADGYVLTNFHVVAGQGHWLQAGLTDGDLHDAVLVGLDPIGDLALIKLLDRSEFPFAPMGDSDALRVGDEVLAMGNPFLLASDFQPTVTLGIVSGVSRYQPPDNRGLLEYTDCIQTDAAINPGNSGGPLFNMKGEVIGINGRISLEKRGRVSVGVGYAISINQARQFLPALKGGLIVDHANLGARVGTDEAGRVVVTEIERESEAYKRGLRVDDEIVTFAGRRIASGNQFLNVLGIFPKGWPVELTFRRDGATATMALRLAGSGRDLSADKPVTPPGPRKPSEPKAEKKKIETKKAARPPTRPIPRHVDNWHEARVGFANYRFNALARDAILSRFRDAADFSAARGTWTVTLTSEKGTDAKVVLSDKAGLLTMGQETFTYEPGDEAAEPPGSGGLVAALFHWRRLLVSGPNAFNSLDYAGAMPALPVSKPGVPSDLDPTLRGERAGAESLYLFDPTSGALRQLVCQVGGNEPCEIDLSGAMTIDGRLLPQRWTVRSAGQTFGVFTLKSLEVAP